MSLEHATKSVLITGAAHRLGAAIARAFGEAGWHVVLHYRASGAAAEALAQALPSAETVQCDLADSGAAVTMVEALAARLPDWRVLINNASTFAEDRADAIDPQVNVEAMAVNAVTPVRMTQAFLARAQSSAGRRVIQVTDQKLRNPNPDFFSYTMSKHAADSAAVMLAMACKGKDRVFRLAPGAILPSHDQTEAEAEISHRLNPLARRTGAGEIADAALFLSTAPLANGQALFIDSGQHLLAQPRDVLYLARERGG